MRKVNCCLCFEGKDLSELRLMPDGNREDVCKDCHIADLESQLRKKDHTIEALNDYKSMKLHIDKYFESNKRAMNAFIKWLRENPYPQAKVKDNVVHALCDTKPYSWCGAVDARKRSELMNEVTCKKCKQLVAEHRNKG